jgi:MOSC domain-containing protein YiiM
MPVRSPSRLAPAPVLNAVYPHVRVLHQLASLLIYCALLPLTRLRQALAPPPKSLVAPGRVVHVAASWRGSVPKRSLRAGFVSRTGMLFDRQASPLIAAWGGHGGTTKAVCLFDAAVLRSLVADGHPIGPGSIGEQLLLDGLPWTDVARPGARLQVGRDVVLEVSEVTMPCGTIRGAFLKGNNSAVDARKHPGQSRWYARVLRDGWVRSGDSVLVLRLPTARVQDAVAAVTRSLRSAGEAILDTGAD